MTELKVIKQPGKYQPTAPQPLSGGIRSGDILWLSGQTSRDPDTGQPVKGDIKVQTEQVIDNIEALLKVEGCGLERVVRCTVFLCDPMDIPGMNEVYLRRFKKPYPARAAYVISGFTNREYRVEIDAIAGLP